MRASKAVRQCAEWLTFCLSIGWQKEQLDALEALWWKYHDENGDLKQIAVRQFPEVSQ